MTLTIHRGTHEIGGSCVELRTAEARILVDFGMPLDFDKHSEEEQNQILKAAAEWCKGVDAIFLSHSHADHYGLLQLVADGTPVYATEETFAMLALDSILFKDPTAHLKRCKMQSYNPYVVGGLTITAYPIDHSAYGACAFMFEADGKRVLYSGDVRLHGVKGALYKQLPREVDYLLLEGTNIARERNYPTERDIEERFIETFDAAPNALHLVWCSSKNIDRICALFRACLKRGKTLVVDPYTANVLNVTSKINPKIPSAITAEQIKVYFSQRLTTRLTERNRKEYIFSLNPRKNKVTHTDISANPERYVMLVRQSSLSFLQKIKTEHIRFIKSIWSGYWSEPNTKQFRQWVEAHCEELPDIHSSGHADIRSLKRIVEHIRPQTIVPIHTDSPSSFSTLFCNNKVMLLNDNEEITLQ